MLPQLTLGRLPSQRTPLAIKVLRLTKGMSVMAVPMSSSENPTARTIGSFERSAYCAIVSALASVTAMPHTSCVSARDGLGCAAGRQLASTTALPQPRVGQFGTFAAREYAIGAKLLAAAWRIRRAHGRECGLLLLLGGSLRRLLPGLRTWRARRLRRRKAKFRRRFRQQLGHIGRVAVLAKLNGGVVQETVRQFRLEAQVMRGAANVSADDPFLASAFCVGQLGLVVRELLLVAFALAQGRILPLLFSGFEFSETFGVHAVFGGVL